MPKKLYCSFCGKSREEVLRLIDGPHVYICDECIDLMYGMIHDADQPALGQLAIELAELRKAKLLKRNG